MTPDDNLITPGVVGFVVTVLIAIATVFLILDMTRRIRRTRYREEVREKLEIERLEAELAASGPPEDTESPEDSDPDTGPDADRPTKGPAGT